jgi:hypothetical protein
MSRDIVDRAASCGAGEGGVSLSKLPSGRWRAQVYDSSLGRNVSVSLVLGGPGTFATKTEAKRAREQARERLGDVRTDALTLGGFWERWTTDPLFARPKESTNIHNRERTGTFVKRYGARRMDAIDDTVVAEWLAGGKRNSTIPALRAMFNDAASAKGGRLVRQNPFARLGISRGPGRRHEQPPSEEEVWKLIRCARELASPSLPAGSRSPRSQVCVRESWMRYVVSTSISLALESVSSSSSARWLARSRRRRTAKPGRRR